MSIKNNQQGFTILELLIATMVFSVIFLATTTALLQLGKLYYKGLVTSRTQEATRGITDQISQQLQLGGGDLVKAVPKQYPVTSGTDTGGGKLTFQTYCIGNTRYTYRLNTKVDTSLPAGTYQPSTLALKNALWRDTVVASAGCTPADLSRVSGNGEDMLGQNMRLTDFTLNCDSITENVCSVGVGIIYGDNDLLTPDSTTIQNNEQSVDANAIKTLKCDTIVGNHWCAGSQLTTTVLKRLGGN